MCAKSLICSRLLVSLGRADWWWHAPVYSLRTLVCDFFVLALVRYVSSSEVPAGLDIGPAGPGLVAKLLTVEALQWSSHKGPHSDTPVPSGKSDGVLFLYQYYLYQTFVSLCSILSSGSLLVPPCPDSVVPR